MVALIAGAIQGVISGVLDFLKPVEDVAVVYQLPERQKNIGVFLIAALFLVLLTFIVTVIIKKV